MQLIRTVSGMANNLNQIAHRLNAFGISALNERTECAETTYSRTYETIEAMIAKIIKEQTSVELSVICLTSVKVKSRFYKPMACAVLSQMYCTRLQLASLYASECT